ncbi:unnamed protein product [Moneuplotes crassus]|uniref:Uncharacterized protein n=1 Tax=Euplotes crassus TaxID=5936 RepID=A0AAD1UK63_EUPCR|nr:unnamed protein product [Moneuplotes crassus]
MATIVCLASMKHSHTCIGSANLFMITTKYNLHNFCLCDYQSGSIFLRNASCSKIPEILTPKLNNSEEIDRELYEEKAANKSSKKLLEEDASESLANENFEKFVCDQVKQNDTIPRFPIFELSKRKLKKIERNFTHSNARKDVIYKAILRFFRRTCQTEIKQMKCSACSYKLYQDFHCCHNEEKSTEYLESKLDLPVTSDCLEVFQIIISIGSHLVPPESPIHEFTTHFKSCMEKYNRKKLHEILLNKYFAVIFLKFWQRSEVFQNMVNSLNSKRDEEINEGAHRYYLHKLMHNCIETLQGCKS